MKKGPFDFISMKKKNVTKKLITFNYKHITKQRVVWRKRGQSLLIGAIQIPLNLYLTANWPKKCTVAIDDNKD